MEQTIASPPRGGQHEPAAMSAPFATGPWVIVRREALPHHVCRWSQEHRVIDTPWIACLDRRAASRAAIASGACAGGVPAGLLKMLDLLNAELPDVGGDDPNVGLVDTTHPCTREQAVCGYSFERYEEPVPTLGGRGRWDIAWGLTPGCSVKRLGHFAAHVLAPGLASTLDRKFRTSPPASLYTRAERRDRAEAEDRRRAADAQAGAEQAAASELADVLFGDRSPAAVDRARHAVAAIDAYQNILARRAGR